MRRAFAITMMVLAGSALLLGGDVVDRIVVTVNRQPILLSDWDVAMRYEAFLEQRPLPLSDQAARAVLDRLVDQQLLREQMGSTQMRPVHNQELAERLRSIREATGASSDAAFRRALAIYGLNETELAERVENQLRILRFVDTRLRPAVHVDRRSIEAYYNETLLPELRKKGARQAPLAEVSGQIEELLSQQRLDALLSEWLKELREHSDIRMDLGPPAASAVGQESP